MNENGRSFRVNWFDIISKVIFLIIFVLILMWFFPNNANNSDNSSDDSVLDKYNFSVLFDRIFRENLNEMKYAAKSYFTLERMPGAGEEKTLTLQEMYDLNLLLPLIDKDNKACDANKSIVRVTKEGEEYHMKITLSCGDETKTITEIIGCYDFCQDNNCKEELATKLQYQFMREVEKTTYSCPSGYTLKGKYCYSTEFGKRIEATEILSKDKVVYEDAKKNTGEHKVCTEITEVPGETTYSCPEGYELDGTKCTKVEYTEPTTSQEYTCPEGYEKNGNYCYKTDIKSADQSYAYTCPFGYSLNGTECTKTLTSNTSLVLNGYTCPSGCSPTGNGSTCQTKTTKAATVTSKVTGYKCPSGYTQSGSTCTKRVQNGYSYGGWRLVGTYTYDYKKATYTNETSKLVATGTSEKQSCAGCGFTTYYHYAYYTRSKTANYTTYTTNATKVVTNTYSCKGIGGTLTGKNCVITTIKSCKPNYKNTCTIGTLVGNVCKLTDTIDASKIVDGYSCPAGYTLKDNICEKVEVIPATPTEGEKSCPDGYVMDGNKCKKTTTIPADETTGEPTYSCPDGFTKEPDNSACCRVETIEGDYYCENSNAVLEGNKCKITIPGGEVIGYSCPNGYTKEGKYCYKKTTKKINATSKTVVTYEYKWSYFKSLPGWTRTGKTRNA